ncbi:MAG: DUF1249 domain-containing protein [Gammaproteobacteria bacterium]|nr:MAG: DUF1249 domain-containing protein [Gammaproteobacteria bacterium]RLA49871.1 MAG: DUF1249 domain-containing protein [Gammaproteobacteria bacterium]
MNKKRGGHLRYKVDLKNFMARCEANYRRLHKVFPDMAGDQVRRLGLTTMKDREVVLSVKERTPFTTLLVIEEQSAQGSDRHSEPGWRRPPTLTVRMYHDAKVAEVVACDRMRNVQPKNRYPNKSMLQRDEKAQWNRFLEEWLAVCIEYGYVSTSTRVLLSNNVV